MVNIYEDLDINGCLFYYKGHVVHLYNVPEDVTNTTLKYFIYNDRKIYIDPKDIRINDKTGNMHYYGSFIY